MEMNEKTVGMLSKFTGVSVHTIKYYEKLGFISSERGEQSNYRFYGVRSCTDIYECVKYYHQFRKEFPESAVYGFRLKISVNENGVSSDCFRFLLPA